MDATIVSSVKIFIKRYEALDLENRFKNFNRTFEWSLVISSNCKLDN